MSGLKRQPQFFPACRKLAILRGKSQESVTKHAVVLTASAPNELRPAHMSLAPSVMGEQRNPVLYKPKETETCKVFQITAVLVSPECLPSLFTLQARAAWVKYVFSVEATKNFHVCLHSYNLASFEYTGIV
jgi:hypothetical protein